MPHVIIPQFLGTTNTGTLLSTIKECIPDVQVVEDIGRVLCIVIPAWKNAVSERCRQIKHLAERLDSLKSYLGIENYEIRQSTLEEVMIYFVHFTHKQYVLQIKILKIVLDWTLLILANICNM